MRARRVSIEGAESCFDFAPPAGSVSAQGLTAWTRSGGTEVSDGTGFKHHLTTVHMDHSDVLAGRVGQAFNRHCNSQASVVVKLLKTEEWQQTATQWVVTFDAILFTGHGECPGQNVNV
jgi:hypothetical protein